MHPHVPRPVYIVHLCLPLHDRYLRAHCNSQTRDYFAHTGTIQYRVSTRVSTTATRVTTLRTLDCTHPYCLSECIDTTAHTVHEHYSPRSAIAHAVFAIVAASLRRTIPHHTRYSPAHSVRTAGASTSQLAQCNGTRSIGIPCVQSRWTAPRPSFANAQHVAHARLLHQQHTHSVSVQRHESCI